MLAAAVLIDFAQMLAIGARVLDVLCQRGVSHLLEAVVNGQKYGVAGLRGLQHRLARQRAGVGGLNQLFAGLAAQLVLIGQLYAALSQYIIIGVALFLQRIKIVGFADFAQITDNMRDKIRLRIFPCRGDLHGHARQHLGIFTDNCYNLIRHILCKRIGRAYAELVFCHVITH